MVLCYFSNKLLPLLEMLPPLVNVYLELLIPQNVTQFHIFLKAFLDLTGQNRSPTFQYFHRIQKLNQSPHVF